MTSTLENPSTQVSELDQNLEAQKQQLKESVRALFALVPTHEQLVPGYNEALKTDTSHAKILTSQVDVEWTTAPIIDTKKPLYSPSLGDKTYFELTDKINHITERLRVKQFGSGYMSESETDVQPGLIADSPVMFELSESDCLVDQPPEVFPTFSIEVKPSSISNINQMLEEVITEWKCQKMGGLAVAQVESTGQLYVPEYDASISNSSRANIYDPLTHADR